MFTAKQPLDASWYNHVSATSKSPLRQHQSLQNGIKTSDRLVEALKLLDAGAATWTSQVLEARPKSVSSLTAKRAKDQASLAASRNANCKENKMQHEVGQVPAHIDPFAGN